jgi:hypothetical protein
MRRGEEQQLSAALSVCQTNASQGAVPASRTGGPEAVGQGHRVNMNLSDKGKRCTSKLDGGLFAGTYLCANNESRSVVCYWFFV